MNDLQIIQTNTFVNNFQKFDIKCSLRQNYYFVTLTCQGK